MGEEDYRCERPSEADSRKVWARMSIFTIMFDLIGPWQSGEPVHEYNVKRGHQSNRIYTKRLFLYPRNSRFCCVWNNFKLGKPMTHLKGISVVAQDMPLLDTRLDIAHHALFGPRTLADVQVLRRDAHRIGLRRRVQPPVDLRRDLSMAAVEMLPWTALLTNQQWTVIFCLSACPLSKVASGCRCACRYLSDSSGRRRPEGSRQRDGWCRW